MKMLHRTPSRKRLSRLSSVFTLQSAAAFSVSAGALRVSAAIPATAPVPTRLPTQMIGRLRAKPASFSKT